MNNLTEKFLNNMHIHYKFKILKYLKGKNTPLESILVQSLKVDCDNLKLS